MEATGLPHDRFCTPRIAISMSQVTAISENAIKTNLQKPACFTGKPKHAKQPTTNKLSKADELAQHSHHHTALFLRVGAGGRGRSP